MARRINTKFLAITASSAIGLVLIGVGVKKFIIKENPQQYIAAGDLFLKNRQFADAAKNYGKAASLSPRDVQLLNKLGISQWNATDPEIRSKAAASWNRALQLDPDFMPAEAGLLEFYWTVLGSRGNKATAVDFRQVIDAAKRMAEMEAKDKSGKTDPVRMPGIIDRLSPEAMIPITTLRMWQNNLPVNSTTVNDALAQLAKLADADPTNAEFPLWIGMSKRHMAVEASRSGQPSDAFSLFDEAAGVFDQSLAKHPENAHLLYARCMLLDDLTSADPRPKAQGAYKVAVRDSLEQAQAKIDSADPLYLGIKSAWAMQVARTDPAAGEKQLRDLLKDHANDLNLTLRLAQLLSTDPARLSEAVDLLEAFPAYRAAINMTGAARDSALAMRAIIAERLTDIRLNMLERAEAEKRGPLEKSIKSDIDLVSASRGEDPSVLKLRARLYLLQENARDAILALNQAMMLTNQRSDAVKDYALTQLLVQAYLSGGQNGQAHELLNSMLEDPRAAGDVQFHRQLSLMMCDVCLKEGDSEGFRRQMTFLKANFSDDPAVMRMQLRGATMSPADALALYEKLPEATRPQKTEKARYSLSLGKFDDAVRLYKESAAIDPPDPDVSTSLIRTYILMGRKDDAQSAAQAAIKQFPDNSTIKLMADSLSGASPEQMDKTTMGIIDQVKDPYQRELALAQHATQQKKDSEALDHLQKAVNLQPTGAIGLVTLFNYYVDRGQFKEAAAEQAKIAALDIDQAHGQFYALVLALAKKDTQTALAIGRQLTHDYPEFSKSWEYMGQALEAAGELEDAISKYNLALEKQANNFNAMSRAVHCSQVLGQFDQARTYIDRSIQRFPEDPRYREMKINHELKYGDPDSVMPSVLEAVNTHPDDDRYPRMAADALYRSAGLKWARGDRDAALAQLKQESDLLDKGIAKWPDSAAFYILKARAAMAAGTFDVAETALKQMLARPALKDNLGSLNTMAQFYLQVGKPELAEAPLREAIAKSGNSPQAQQQLASVLTAEGKFDQALAALDEKSDSPIIRKQRVVTLMEAGRASDAENVLTSAIKANAKDASAYEQLAYVYYATKRFDDAVKICQQGLAADPKNLTILYYRGLVSLRRPGGDLNDAIRDLSDVRDKSVGDINSRMALADAYEARHDSDSAMRELRGVLEISPENKAARVHLAELNTKTTPPRWDEARRLIEEGRAIPVLRDDPDLMSLQATTVAATGDTAKALDLIRQAIQKYPKNTTLVQRYFELLMTTGNYTQVVKETDSVLNSATPKSPVPWWVYHVRGLAKLRTKDAAGGMKDLQQALDSAAAVGDSPAEAVVETISNEMGPDQALKLVAARANSGATWRLLAARMAARTGDVTGALRYIEAALDSFDQLSPPQQRMALHTAGELYLQQKPSNVSKAISSYEKLLTLAPGDPIALNSLAYLLAEMSEPPQPQRALQYSQQAFDIMTQAGRFDPALYDTQGWVLILSGRVDDGLDLLRKAADKAPLPEAHYHLGEGYLRKKFPEDAKRELGLAGDLVDQAIKDNKPVDAGLRPRIDGALKRAEDMIQANSAGGNGKN